MDVKEKLISRYSLAVTIQKIILNYGDRNEEGLVISLRKLAASSQTEYAIIQKITSSKKDPRFSTLVAIIDGFEISFSEFSKVYDSVTEKEIEEYKNSLKKEIKTVQINFYRNKGVSEKIS